MQNSTERACVLCNTIKNAHVFYINNRMTPKVFSVASKIQHFQDGRCTSARDCCSCKKAISCCMEKMPRKLEAFTFSLTAMVSCLSMSRSTSSSFARLQSENSNAHWQRACSSGAICSRRAYAAGAAWSTKMTSSARRDRKKMLLTLIQPTFFNFLIKLTHFKLERQFQQTKNLANL